MIDLNSTLFFKGKFGIHTEDKEKDLLWDLVLKIRDWMFYKWRRNGEKIPYDTPLWTGLKLGSYLSSENEIVHFKSVYHKDSNDLDFWACKVIEAWPSKNGCAPREWTTEIGFEQKSETSAIVSIVIYFSDRPGFIGPCEPIPPGSIPNIIRKFIDDTSIECTTEGYPFNMKATHLVPGDFPSFWRIVCDETREIPVIYISPRRIEDTSSIGKNLIDPQKLMNLLGPNALVFYSDDIDFSREMTQLCDPQSFACYSGGIRVYASHPRIGDKDDSYRHRYINARNIIESGDDIYEMLRRALAQDVHFYDKMFRMEDCKALNDRVAAEKRKQEYRESLENALLDTAVKKEKSLDNQLLQIEEERFQWELEREKFDAQIKELKSDLHQSKTREDAYRDAALLSNSRKEALDSLRNIPQYPETPQEIAEYFTVHFGDRIVFTERGKASLRDCTTEPSVLWDALYQISTVLYDLFEDENVVLVDQEFNRRSKLRFARGEGTMTRKDSGLMRQYHDVYQGKDLNIEAHIKTKETRESNPKFLRIYFCYDNELHKIIIGSCGKHLENYTTGKIK